MVSLRYNVYSLERFILTVALTLANGVIKILDVLFAFQLVQYLNKRWIFPKKIEMCIFFTMEQYFVIIILFLIGKLDFYFHGCG